MQYNIMLASDRIRRRQRRQTTAVFLLPIILTVLSASTVSAQEVANVITSLVSDVGCFNTGPDIGDANLYDGTTSNYLCPTPPSLTTVPSLIVNSDKRSIVTKLRVYASSTPPDIKNPGNDPTSYQLEGIQSRFTEPSTQCVNVIGSDDDNWCREVYSDEYTLWYKINVPNGVNVDTCDGCTMSFEVEYDGEGWVSVGFSTNGEMVSSEAVM